MRSLSVSQVVDVWERGAGQHPADRALTLLSACSGEPPEQLALASLGHRDGLLLQAYARNFGDTLNAFAECPQCAERLEYSLSACDLAGSATAVVSTPEFTLAEGDLELRMRLPNSFDVGAAAACPDIAAARRLLLERCVVKAERGAVPVAIDALSQSTVEWISQYLAEADPQAEVLIDLTCSGCGCQWQIIFEIERFFWTRISAMARRLLREVDTLARAYGWTQQDILALSPLRRQCYLNMVS